MRTWNIIAIVLLISCISAAQDLSILGFVHGIIEIDPGSSTYIYTVTLYDSDTDTWVTDVSGQLIDTVHYKTPRYDIGAWTGYPLVDVECVITDGLDQVVYYDIVYDVEGVHYNQGGAQVDFDFTDACESYSSSAAVEEPSNGTSAFDTDTWAGIKSGN